MNPLMKGESMVALKFTSQVKKVKEMNKETSPKIF